MSLMFGALALLLAAEITTDKPPVIPMEVEAEYYRADGVVAHMKPAWEAANTDLQAAIVAIQKSCGDKFVVAAAGKHLVCAPKPEPPKEVPKQ